MLPQSPASSEQGQGLPLVRVPQRLQGLQVLVSSAAEYERDIGRTGNRKLLSIFCVYPLTVNKALVTDETGVLESELLVASPTLSP